MTLDELLDVLAVRRGTTCPQARERLAAMPGGGELLSGGARGGLPLAAELLADDPE